MKTEEEIRKQIKLSYEELEEISNPDNDMSSWRGRILNDWRKQKKYIDALEWVLGEI